MACVVFRDDQNQTLPSAWSDETVIEHGAQLFDALELDALLGDRQKQSDMLHAVERRKRAFRRGGGVDVRRDHEQRHGLFVRLRHGGHDIGRAAARGHQTAGFVARIASAMLRRHLRAAR
jgi:hypothetical protein